MASRFLILKTVSLLKHENSVLSMLEILRILTSDNNGEQFPGEQVKGIYEILDCMIDFPVIGLELMEGR